MATVEFKNIEKVRRSLLAMAKRVEKSAQAEALRKAARPIVRQAKANAKANDRTGHLRKSIKAKTRRTRAGVRVYVTTDRDYAANIPGRKKKYKPGYIGHLVEFGFKHKRGKSVGSRPFLEMAFKSHSGEAIRIYHANIKGVILRHARRIGNKK